MTRSICVHPAAKRDIDAQSSYYVSNASARVAIRFEDAIEETLKLIVDQPEIGAIYDATQPRLLDLRFWPVRDFREHLIFYRSTAHRIEVVRILHGRRDLDSVLG